MKAILVLLFAILAMVATAGSDVSNYRNINSLRLLLRHLEETENEKEIQSLDNTNANVEKSPVQAQTQVKIEQVQDRDKTDVEVQKKPPIKPQEQAKSGDDPSERSHTSVDFHMISVSRHEIENYMWDIWHRLESAEDDLHDVLQQIENLQNTLPGEVEHHLEDILESYQELGDHLDHYLLFNLNDLLIKIYIFGIEGHCLPDCMENLANMGHIGVDHVVSLFDCILNVDANLLESWETAYQEMLTEPVPQECANFQAIADSHDLEGSCPDGMLQVLPVIMTNGLECIKSGILSLKDYMDIHDSFNTILYQGSNAPLREYITTVIFHTHNLFDKAYDMADPVGVVIECVYEELYAGAGEDNSMENFISNSTKSLNPSQSDVKMSANDKLQNALKRRSLFTKNWSRSNYQKHMKGLYLRRGKY